MYELIKAGEVSCYIDCPSRVGIVKIGDGKAVLIDSGNDRSMGKRIKKILDTEGLTLSAIYNTHHHADHIGANKYLSEIYGCKIYAPRGECGFIEHTIYEPTLLYGANPPSMLRCKFLVAEESTPEPINPENMPRGLEVISLPGHTPDMVGFKTCDGVVYLADCLSSIETLDKYKIGVIYDVESYLLTLDAVKEMQATLFVPSHATPTENIAPLAQYNIDAVNSIANKIAELCSAPTSLDGLIKAVFDSYALTASIEQYALVGSTVRSYVSYLISKSVLEFCIEENAILVRRRLEK